MPRLLFCLVNIWWVFFSAFVRVLQSTVFSIHKSSKEESEWVRERKRRKSCIDFCTSPVYACMLMCSRRCFQYINRLCWINTMIVRALHTLPSVTVRHTKHIEHDIGMRKCLWISFTSDKNSPRKCDWSILCVYVPADIPCSSNQNWHLEKFWGIKRSISRIFCRMIRLGSHSLYLFLLLSCDSDVLWIFFLPSLSSLTFFLYC